LKSYFGSPSDTHWPDIPTVKLEQQIFQAIRQAPPPSAGGRRLALSDIHGCALTFRALLEKVGLNRSDQLFILGDLINRGPRSSEVVDDVLGLIDGGYDVHTLRGNHEEILLHIAKAGPQELPLLLRTRNAMDMLNKEGRVRKRFLSFFKGLPYCIETEGFYLVHAGFNLAASDPMSDFHAMVWQRPFMLMEGTVSGRRVVHGHQPQRMSRIRRAVEEGHGAICIDNGCTHGYLGEGFGALVCLDLDSGELWRKKNLDARR
jgi:serine/threonine protein phosphatase 1